MMLSSTHVFIVFNWIERTKKKNNETIETINRKFKIEFHILLKIEINSRSDISSFPANPSILYPRR